MGSDVGGTPEGWSEREGPLLEVDPRLNIYALANGLDLLKNDSGHPDRTLEWYREGMERRVRLEVEEGAPDRFVLWAGASRKERGVRREVLVPVRRGIPASDLRDGMAPLLEDAIRRADALTPDHLTPPSTDRDEHP